jgi:hypothetical protein
MLEPTTTFPSAETPVAVEKYVPGSNPKGVMLAASVLNAV